MANAEFKPPAWKITRLFLLPNGEFISRPVAIVHAETQEAAINAAAQDINGIAILKAHKLNANAKCPVCGHRINAKNCRPTRQKDAA